jgi:putative hydrolases of HD superfamily
MNQLGSLLDFVAFTHKFNQIKRSINATGEDRRETDSEHSYQMALVAWYIISSQHLDLDLTLCLQYAIAHDLVEIYAGDTYFYTTDQTARDSKKSREADALEVIAKEFSEFPELATIIAKYENKTDSESLFIYALDKLLPAMNIFLDNGKSWHIDQVTFDMLYEGKKDKVAVSPIIKEYWDSFIMELEPQKAELFFSQK